MENLYGNKYIDKCTDFGAIHSNLDKKKYTQLLIDWEKLDLNEKNIALFSVSLSGPQVVEDCSDLMELNMLDVEDEVLGLICITVSKYADLREAYKFIKNIYRDIKTNFVIENIEQALSILEKRVN